MKIDIENGKCIITKAELNNLFALDTFEEFEKACEEMVKEVNDGLSVILLYDYLKRGMKHDGDDL